MTTTITLPRATVEQALHVAENAGYPLALIKALRAALAQQAEPVQEPVAWLYEAGTDRTLHWYKPPLRGTPLYTSPPQRKPLTEEEATALVQSVVSNSDRPIGMVAYGLLVVGAIERAHGIKE